MYIHLASLICLLRKHRESQSELELEDQGPAASSPWPRRHHPVWSDPWPDNIFFRSQKGVIIWQQPKQMHVFLVEIHEKIAFAACLIPPQHESHLMDPCMFCGRFIDPHLSWLPPIAPGITPNRSLSPKESNSRQLDSTSTGDCWHCWWFRNPKEKPPFGCIKIWK